MSLILVAESRYREMACLSVIGQLTKEASLTRRYSTTDHI